MLPAVGSLVYCNLGVVAEHSGIYVGGNKIVHLSGDGHIEKVSDKKRIIKIDLSKKINAYETSILPFQANPNSLNLKNQTV